MWKKARVHWSTVPALLSRSCLRNEVRAVKAQKFPPNQGVCSSALVQFVSLSPESSLVGIARIMTGGAIFFSEMNWVGKIHIPFSVDVL